MKTPIQFGAPLDYGFSPTLQWIEVSSVFQIPHFQIIGLPSPEVAEARDRVRSAIQASDLEFPRKRITLNLSPASVRKRGTGLDLAMALSILAQDQLEPDLDRAKLRIAAWGELGLDGTIKAAGNPLRTWVGACDGKADFLFISSAEESSFTRLWPMIEQAHPSRRPPRLVAVTTLKDAWEQIRTGAFTSFSNVKPPLALISDSGLPDHSATPGGQGLLPLPPSLERIIGITVSGSHHLLLLGPKGVGKSHALEWITQLRPKLSLEAQLQNMLLWELSHPQSIASEQLQPRTNIRWISPQVRPASLTGSLQNQRIRPGEFSLAHGGLFIADEFLEWHRDSREVLREPLEKGRVTLTRAQGSVEFPARFQFIGTGNLCPCGGIPTSWPTASASMSLCRCPPQRRRAYIQRLSGPILDRIDLALIWSVGGDSAQYSARDAHQQLLHLRTKTHNVREKLIQRWGTEPAHLSSKEIEELIQAHPTWQRDLGTLTIPSLRSRHKLVRIALSLCAWDEREEPNLAHFSEAACYRSERFFES